MNRTEIIFFSMLKTILVASPAIYIHFLQKIGARKDQILKGLAEGEANSDFVPIEVAILTEIHLLGKQNYTCAYNIYIYTYTVYNVI